MQLAPATARQFAADASVPEQNIDAATRYLRFLIEKYRNASSPMKCAIAAYNAGYPPLIVTRVFLRFARRKNTWCECWHVCRNSRVRFDRREIVIVAVARAEPVWSDPHRSRQIAGLYHSCSQKSGDRSAWKGKTFAPQSESIFSRFSPITRC